MNQDPQPSFDWKSMLASIRHGDHRMLARGISFVENESPGYEQLMEQIPFDNEPDIVGITGPPGAGKSSLGDLLIGHWVEAGKKVAVLCIDPSSPFHSGALLGDRIRMSGWYNHPQVYIRSLASRGSLGGLNPKIIEITDLIKAAPVDIILIETVGVGQNEVEIASLAETTVVVLVPETGDDIQAMKSGLLEIADLFVVNKSDRPDADHFVRHLQSLSSLNANAAGNPPAILKTIATQNQGIHELAMKIAEHQHTMRLPAQKNQLLAEKAFQLILQKKMKGIDKKSLEEEISREIGKPGFNLYRMIADY